MSRNQDKVAERNFDEWFHQWVASVERMQRSAVALDKDRTMIKNSAYLAMVSLISMEQYWHNRLIEQVRSFKEYHQAADAISAWLDDSFRPLAVIGEDWRDLRRLIDEGVSRRQYLKSESGAACVSKKKRQRIAAELAKVPPPPPPACELPVEEQLAQQSARAAALERRNKLLKQENGELRRRVAVLENQVEKLRRQLVRMNRIVAEPVG